MGDACIPSDCPYHPAHLPVAGQDEGPFHMADLPIFIVPIALHLSDITFTILGGFTEILWIVLLASAIQTALLAFAWLDNRQAGLSQMGKATVD